MITYELYDVRYLTEPDRSFCFEVCETLAEAMKNKDDYGYDTVIVKSVSKKVGERKYDEISSEIIFPEN